MGEEVFRGFDGMAFEILWRRKRGNVLASHGLDLQIGPFAVSVPDINVVVTVGEGDVLIGACEIELYVSVRLLKSWKPW